MWENVSFWIDDISLASLRIILFSLSLSLPLFFFLSLSGLFSACLPIGLFRLARHRRFHCRTMQTTIYFTIPEARVSFRSSSLRPVKKLHASRFSARPRRLRYRPAASP